MGLERLDRRAVGRRVESAGEVLGEEVGSLASGDTDLEDGAQLAEVGAPGALGDGAEGAVGDVGGVVATERGRGVEDEGLGEGGEVLEAIAAWDARRSPPQSRAANRPEGARSAAC